MRHKKDNLVGVSVYQPVKVQARAQQYTIIRMERTVIHAAKVHFDCLETIMQLPD